MPRFSAAIRTQILAHDERRSEPVIHVITNGSSAHAFESIALRRLQVEESLSEYQRLQRAAQKVEERPTVFVVESPSREALGLSDAANLFLDRIENVGGTVHPTIILLELRTPLSGGVPFDFTIGLVAEPTFVHEQTKDVEAWREYLHRRLAWEAGGDPLLAESWDRKFAVGICSSIN
jgi:hypothetical protein